MLKKLLSLLVALCMVLALAPAALAADADADGTSASADGLADIPVRETDYLEDQPHADVDYADMEITPVTEEDFTAAIDAVKALISSGAPNTQILDAFHVVSDLMDTLSGNMTILGFRKSADVTDEESKDAYNTFYALLLEVEDPFIYLIQDILKSGCRDYFITSDRLTESDVSYYESYTGMSEEEKALMLKLTDLDNAYNEAYYAGDIDAMVDTYMEVLATNTAYMQYVDDYDNYVDYAYAEIYGRDYTTEDAKAFFGAVKEYIVPLLGDFDTLNTFDQYMGGDEALAVLQGDYTDDETLALIRPYIGRMSGELLTAWDYMVDHHLYDIAPSEVKEEVGKTSQIAGYNAPFFFNRPGGSITDFTTIIHEFGHYNNFFCHPNDWNEGSCSYDVAEVHSQGMELLFSQFYDEIFGDMGNVVEDYLFYNMLISGVVNGARMAELELYAYTTPDVTAEMINSEYAKISAEYSLMAGDYNWIYIPHLTSSPMYYISYATSAIGALAFWNEAQEQGFDAATDLYLQFVSQPYYAEFQEEFEEILGVNPMDPDYIAEIADNLFEKLQVVQRLQEYIPSSDISSYSDSNFTVYLYCGFFGVINGFEDGLYHPELSSTRAQAAQAFYNILSSLTDPPEGGSPFADVTDQWYADAANFCAAYGIMNGYYNDKGELIFDGDALLTREQLSVVLYNALTLLFGSLDTSATVPFADAGSISPWAVDAMNALANLGMIGTDDAGNINPQRIENRRLLAGFAFNLLIQLI